MVGDVVTAAAKIIRSSDTCCTRISILQALSSLIQACGQRFSDCFPEILKICSKYATDKSIDTRMTIANIISHIVPDSNGFVSVSSDALLAIAFKGLEDEVAVVQSEFAVVTSLIFSELISLRAEELALAKQVSSYRAYPNFAPDLSQFNPNFAPDLSQLNPDFTPDLSQFNPNLHPNFITTFIYQIYTAICTRIDR
jgi:hypothetical protein